MLPVHDAGKSTCRVVSIFAVARSGRNALEAARHLDLNGGRTERGADGQAEEGSALMIFTGHCTGSSPGILDGCSHDLQTMLAECPDLVKNRVAGCLDSRRLQANKRPQNGQILMSGSS